MSTAGDAAPLPARRRARDPLRAPRARAFLLGAAALAAACGISWAHWLKPEEIVAGINGNTALHEKAGIVRAEQDRDLPRLLLIRVDRAVWETVPAADRLRLARDWFETWRHNVPEGIVAVVDSRSGHSLVNYDGLGNPRLVGLPAPPGPEKFPSPP